MSETCLERWMRQPHFTCPRCNATSWNLSDILERYCGRCHVFVEDYGFGSKRGFDFTKASRHDDDAPVTTHHSTPSSPDPFPSILTTYEPLTPSAPDPPSTIDPGGGSSGGGGASGDW